MNSKQWFPFILANIMFRGLLVSRPESLETMLKYNREEFIQLWENALGKGTLSDLRLYLLPADAISKRHAWFLYPLEFLLRNPDMTKMYKYDANGEFLYTSFDCFHLVLPLTESSKHYFKQYSHVQIFGTKIMLRRCTYPTARATFEQDEKKDKTQAACYNFIKPTEKNFPDILIEISVYKYMSWTKLLIVGIIPPCEPEKVPQSEQKDSNPKVLAIIHPDVEQKKQSCDSFFTNEVVFITQKDKHDDKKIVYTNNEIKDPNLLTQLVKIAQTKSILAQSYNQIQENSSNLKKYDTAYYTITDTLKKRISELEQQLCKKKNKQEKLQLEKKLSQQHELSMNLGQENEKLKRENQHLHQQIVLLHKRESDRQEMIKKEAHIKQLRDKNII